MLIKTFHHRHKFAIRHEAPYRILQRLTSKTYIVQHMHLLNLTRPVTGPYCSFVREINAYFVILILRNISLSESSRRKRFLDSVIHHRINVLEQSHNVHRNETIWIPTVIFSTVTACAIIIIILFIITIYFCRLLHTHVQHRQMLTLAVLQESGLAQMHSGMQSMITILQRRHLHHTLYQ